MATCYDCIHCEVCSGIGSCSYHCSDVSKCKHFKNKADFVEVVRCKDCDVPHNRWTGCPYLNGLMPPSYHYCSKGERKGDENGIKEQNN